MQVSALQITGSIMMRSEDNIRHLIVVQKELMLHEDPDVREVPIKFVKLPDDERRGIIRALRWVIDEDEDLL